MAENKQTYDFVRTNEPLSGLDLKRIIDAFDLWKIKLVPDQEIVFDLGEGRYVGVFSDRCVGCPDVRIWWEDDDEPEVEVNPDVEAEAAD